MTGIKQFHFNLSVDLYNQLEAAAKDKKVPMTLLVIQALRQLLNADSLGGEHPAEDVLLLMVQMARETIQGINEEIANLKNMKRRLQEAKDFCSANDLNVINERIEMLQRIKKRTAVGLGEFIEDSMKDDLF